MIKMPFTFLPCATVSAFSMETPVKCLLNTCTDQNPQCELYQIIKWLKCKIQAFFPPLWLVILWGKWTECSV